jgi:hypothetical protein
MRKAETLKWEGLLTADCRKAGGEDNAEGGFGVAKVGWPVQCRTLMKNKPPVTMDEKVVQYYCLGMQMILRWALLAALTISLASTVRVQAETPPWTYRGFIVSQAGEKTDESLRHAVAAQIDIVLAVGLKRETIQFFQSVPLVLVPAGSIARETPGLYITEAGVVKLTTRIVSAGHKPVLLHELIHAYHHQMMPGGFRNQQVLELYQNAKSNGTFNLKSHMMQNPSEFFACSGTTFLFGVTAVEPFRRERLKEQPVLLGFLREVFGPSCGRYEGSLSDRGTNGPSKPNGAANGSQPIRSKTNSTSSTAGSRR